MTFCAYRGIFSIFFASQKEKAKKWVSKRHAFKPKQINRIVCYWYRRQSTDIVRATMIYCRKVTEEEKEEKEKSASEECEMEWNPILFSITNEMICLIQWNSIERTRLNQNKRQANLIQYFKLFQKENCFKFIHGLHRFIFAS